jgi:hypothetical protein
MQIGISNFKWKLVKNVVNRQQLLFAEAWRHSKFGSRLCKIRWEKHPRSFVKVVEGSEIYNFSIHHFVHFYSNFWRNSPSNRASQNGLASRRDVAPGGTPGAPARAPCLVAPTTLGFRATRAFPRRCAFPRPRAHRGGPKPALSPRYAALTVGPSRPPRASRAGRSTAAVPPH